MLNDAQTRSHITYCEHIVKPIVTSLATNTMSRTNYRSNLKFSHFIMNIPHNALIMLWARHNLNSSIWSRRRNFFPHLKHLALCTTWSHSLGVNPTRNSHVCKYAMINTYSYMSKTPSFSNSISKPWEYLLPMLL